MRVSNLVAGLLVITFAAALYWNARDIPNPGGQPFGPSAFPDLIAALLVLSAIPLLVMGWRARQLEAPFALEPWAREPRRALRFLLVPAGVLFFVLTVGRLGFLPTAFALLFVLLLVGRVPPLRSAAVALATVLAAHSVFYLGLGVQLPWGILQPVAW